LPAGAELSLPPRSATARLSHGTLPRKPPGRLPV